jgi:hypothetical protein
VGVVVLPPVPLEAADPLAPQPVNNTDIATSIKAEKYFAEFE